jgi:putative spermidine/putrescine transport system ATP-binding protein
MHDAARSGERALAPEGERAIPGPLAGGGRASHSLVLKAVTHRFGAAVAVEDVSLDIRPGELAALLGPSGCGKTTLLRAIAGFLTPSEGDVLVDGQSITHVPPHKRNIGIVFQNYALFPHMSVEENVAYGLEARRAPRRLVRETVERMLALVHLEGFRGRYPRELSGGQQQRVALSRVLAVEPRILLLDEPFSALDKNLRLDMQIEIKRIQRELGITAVLVTHDQEEAMSMADRIAVMRTGRVQQFAAPIEIYDRPANLFVNTFVGATNLLSGAVGRVLGSECEVRLDCRATLRLPSPTGAAASERVVVSVRPERFALAAEDGPGRIAGTLTMAMPLGPSTICNVGLGDGTSVKVVVPRAAGAPPYREGQPVYLQLANPSACSVFPHPQTSNQGR